MTALWSNLGGKAMDRFGDLLLSPALAFWFGGLLAWVYSRGWQALIEPTTAGLRKATLLLRLPLRSVHSL